MATRIYNSEVLYLVDGTPLYITPLKIKYLRQFMVAFEIVRKSQGDQDTIENLVECARIAMQQYMPEIKTVEDLEESFDLPEYIYENGALTLLNYKHGPVISAKVAI